MPRPLAQGVPMRMVQDANTDPVADPSQERPADFVDVATIAPTIVIDMRYATADNFVGRPVHGYAARRCFLARPAAEPGPRSALQASGSSAKSS